MWSAAALLPLFVAAPSFSAYFHSRHNPVTLCHPLHPIPLPRSHSNQPGSFEQSLQFIIIFLTILQIPATIPYVPLAFSPILAPRPLLRALYALCLKVPLRPSLPYPSSMFLLHPVRSFARSAKTKLLVFNSLRTLQKR